MGDDRQRTESEQSEESSVDTWLKKAAHVSGPVTAGAVVTLHAGATLLDGRLRLLRRIGEGGMGVVYEAHDEQRGGLVALKTLSRLDAGSVYRLKNEFRSLCDVSHPHLCRLHELFGEGGQWFFTMELIDGERFDRWLRPRAGGSDQGALDEARLRRALPQLVDAVCAIHAAGKLHRDLKPSNVLCTAEGRLVVLDFGLAVDPERGGVGQTVMDESVSGTPAYMAPEQAAGAPATAASDFYAVGAMLFEALTGRLPFEGRTHEMLTDKQRSAARPVAQLRPEAPGDLAELCDALLHRAPAKRPDAFALRARVGGSVPSGPVPRSSHDAPELGHEILGRDDELSTLRGAFEATLAGTPVVLFVSGESGMGKSALCEAFLSSLSGRATVLTGRCYERENVPYKAFDPLVDELSRHLRKLSEREAAALLPRDVRALATLFPVLERVAVVAEAPKREIADPHEMQRLAFDAFAEVTARLRDRQPLVVFIDDLQWTDRDSVRFMRHLLLRSDPTPLLLLCAHRSEGAEHNALLPSMLEAARDNRALSLRALRVGPLPERASAALASRLLGEAATDAGARAIAAESGGSPFFAHELARAAQRGGATGLSLHDALAGHVAALDDGAQRVLRVLALAGQPLPESVALRAAGLPGGHRELDALRSERLVRVSRPDASERTLECYHDKIREGVDAGLSPSLVAELSGSLADALASWPGADSELLTRCLEGAGEPTRAGAYAAAAADAALAALAFDRAARLYDKALALGSFDPARRQALRVARAHALARAGHGVIAAEAYLAARETVGPTEHAELSRLAGEQMMLCGQLDRGRPLMAEAIRPHGIRYPTSLPGVAVVLMYQRSRLRSRGLRLRERANIAPSNAARLSALQMVAQATIRTDFGRGGAFSAQWLREALDAGDPIAAARAVGWELAMATMVDGTVEGLTELIHVGEELTARTGDVLAQTFLRLGRGWARWFLSEPEAALQDFDELLELLTRHPEIENSSYNRRWTELFRFSALIDLCRFDDVAQAWLAQIEDCWARHEMTVLPNFVGNTTGVALFAVGRERELARELARVQAEWAPTEVLQGTIQLAAAEIQHHLWRGDPAGAWQVSEATNRTLRASVLGRIMLREVNGAGLTGAAYAATLSEGSERRAVLRSLSSSAEALERREARGVPMPIYQSMPIRASIAFLQGKPEAAIETLRAFVAREGRIPKPSPLLRACANHRLGELIGGDEGATLISDAQDLLRRGGALEPARLVALLMPGFGRA